MLQNLTIDDTMHLVLIVYLGYLLGRFTDCFIETLNEAIEKIKKKKDNRK